MQIINFYKKNKKIKEFLSIHFLSKIHYKTSLAFLAPNNYLTMLQVIKSIFFHYLNLLISLSPYFYYRLSHLMILF